MRVRFVKSPTCAPFMLAYHIGESADLDDRLAEKLIEEGIAIKEKPAKPENKEAATSKAAAAAEKR